MPIYAIVINYVLSKAQRVILNRLNICMKKNTHSKTYNLAFYDIPDFPHDPLLHLNDAHK